MKEERMDSGELLLSCMKQKLILLTKTSDLTKQMEVHSMQTDIEMGDLADQRQVFLDRLKKCESVIASCNATLPEKQQKRQKKILHGDFPKEECSASETELLECAVKCRELLCNILTMDKQVRERLQNECSRLQNLLHNARKASSLAGKKAAALLQSQNPQHSTGTKMS